MLSLTATELPRFMACNGYKSLGGIEPFNPSTEQTDEGNAAHWLCEQVYHGANAEDLIGQTAPNGLYITADMVEYCRQYLEFTTSGNCEVEVDTSHSGNGWEIRGRADCIKHDIALLTVADLKYGWRIVEPENNWTLISHAIAYCQKNNIQPCTIAFMIFQPRPFHPQGTVRNWIIDYTELMSLYQELSEVLSHPSSTVCSGSQCYKCQCLSQCPAAQIAAMNAIDVAEIAFDSEISNERLTWMLTNLKRAQEIIKQSYETYEDLALHRLKAGGSLKGYSIQQALGQTTWNDGITSDVVKMMSGVDVRVDKIMTPAQAKKAGVPEELIKSMTHRPDNGFKLVAIDENKMAEKMFGKKEI
jgi:hypothetical protein